MAVAYKELVVWVVVDEDGDYDCAGDADDAAARYSENVCDPTGIPRGLRRVKLTVKVPLPQTIELSGEVVADESAAGLTVG